MQKMALQHFEDMENQEHDPNYDETNMPELDSVTWEEPEPRDRFLDLVGTNVARIMYEEGVINAY